MIYKFLNDRVILHGGDCLEILDTLPEASVDSVVCDPPYHLSSIVKRFGAEGAVPAKIGKTGAYERSSRGFMGKQWDGGDIAFTPEVWAKVIRVLKPGGHLLAFSSTRTYHRMACAIEDAGFDIRDQIGWCYGSGFPKSHDIAKAINKANGDSVESAIQWQGWGTALKPAWEPICLARKPLSESSIAANVLRHGTGGINVDGCRIACEPIKTTQGQSIRQQSSEMYSGRDQRDKAAFESHANGRWPANLIHDGSEDVLAGFPDSGPPCGSPKKSTTQGTIAGSPLSQPGSNAAYVGDSGSAARFFYCAKANASDRLGSKHPTVKPLDLMQYLVRLVTPRGGIVLDPFAGTGTTGEAAWREGMQAILIEREEEYQADIKRRMSLANSGPEERKAAQKQAPMEELPMFASLGRDK